MECADRMDADVTRYRNMDYYCSIVKDGLPARVILYLLSFTGFLVSFMMRTDMNMAMVAMARSPDLIDSSHSNDTNHIPNYCYVPVDNETTSSTGAPVDDAEFTWSPTVQNSVIGTFYWFYIVAQIAGGMLTQRFGTKAVFGYSQLATAISSLLMPSAAGLHWSALIFLRSVQGTASGLTWPAMYALVGIWIPEHERSRFMSSFQGFSFGIGVTYMLSGFVIASFGWRVVFYVTGTLGVVWCLFWFLLAYDEPSRHPRISPRELQYIQKHVQLASKGMPPPWGAILTSAPAWVIGITTFGRIWVHYTFMIPGPRYMKTVLGLRIQDNGLLNGVPFIASYFSSVFFCWFADKIHTKGWMTLTNVRKLNTILSQVVPGVFLLLIGYLGCDIVGAMVLWFLAVTLVTAAYAGAMASIVDIAPNLAGPVLAFAQTIHMTASFVAPLVAGAITTDSEELSRWRIVFGVAAAVACLTYIPFQIFGTAHVQDWNYPGGKPPIRPSRSIEALAPLKPDRTPPVEPL